MDRRKVSLGFPNRPFLQPRELRLAQRAPLGRPSSASRTRDDPRFLYRVLGRHPPPVRACLIRNPVSWPVTSWKMHPGTCINASVIVSRGRASGGSPPAAAGPLSPLRPPPIHKRARQSTTAVHCFPCVTLLLLRCLAIQVVQTLNRLKAGTFRRSLGSYGPLGSESWAWWVKSWTRHPISVPQ